MMVWLAGHTRMGDAHTGFMHEIGAIMMIYGVYSNGLYILFDLRCISNFLALVKKDKTVFQCIWM